MYKTVQELQLEVGEYFESAFGQTSLNQRLDDILSEATELYRWSTLTDLRSELGDLLASVLAACHEFDLDAETLIANNRRKIESRMNQYKTLGRKTKVALFGGAFNPITVGHIAVAKFVLDTSGLFDEVWLTPCFKHMNNKTLESPSHRLEMCRIASENDPRIKVFDYEIEHQLAGETYHFVKKLQSDPEYEGTHSFSMIIGMDNANSFHTWVNFQELERLINFVVVHREGQKRDDCVDWYIKGGHVLLKPDDRLIETSSTSFRNEATKYWEAEEIFAASVSLEHKSKMIELCGEKVTQYVIEKSLYTPKQ